jgi:mannose/cellobiose epimerase-like protein (N-acyl-D-glucosamine 2-epimerase family)
MIEARFKGAREAAESAHRWLIEGAWPLWLENGVDWKRGAFHECLDLHSLSCNAGFHRLRVAARQIYVFARAAALGCPGANDAVALGLRFLKRSALQENGGYAQRFDLAGAVLDPSISTYDHAFVLLAYATVGLRDEALALTNFLDRHCRHPLGGYVESLPPKLPRQQNSHLHLYEAFLAAARRFREAIFLDRAVELRRLFLKKLLQPDEGVLPEDFDDNLTPERVEGLYRAEPGHHCEWFWLLAQHSRFLPAGSSSHEKEATSDALMAFVRRYGIHPFGGYVLDEVWSDGTASRESSRLWPQAELIKAECARAIPSPVAVAAAYGALNRHLDPAPRGLWRERLRSDGSWIPGPAPASSLYHLTGAILEGSDAITRAAASSE